MPNMKAKTMKIQKKTVEYFCDQRTRKGFLGQEMQSLGKKNLVN